MVRHVLALLLCWLLLPAAQAQSSYRLQRPPGSVAQAPSSQYYVRTPQPQRGELDLGRSLVGSFANSPAHARPRPSIDLPPVGHAAPVRPGSSVAFVVPTVSELRRLSTRDVVILIDKSGSMSEEDCPNDNVPSMLGRFFFGGPALSGGGISRWEWCRRQTLHVASQLARMPGSNLKIVLFDGRVTEFNNASLGSISEIFNQYRPSGGTDTTKALKTVFNDYFERKKNSGGARPLSVVCITDGAPSSPRSLKNLIIDTSIKVQSPDEIAISFLQIGRDGQGSRLLPELDHELVSQGARFDMVQARSFDAVSRSGLMGALLDTAR